VQVEHEVDQSPLQCRAGSPIKCKTGARNFCAARKIQNIQIFAQLEMLFGFKAENRLFSPGANNRIIFGAAAGYNRFVLNIRYGQNKSVEIFFGNSPALVELFNSGGNIAHSGNQGRCVCFLFLQIADFFGNIVAFTTQRFHFHQYIPAPGIQGEETVKIN